jgi:hypothetical protein
MSSYWVVSEKLRTGKDVKPEVVALLDQLKIEVKSVHNDNMVELVGPPEQMKALKLLIGAKIAK